jgi:glycine/D-amino acid oxidase-like deaminating enzyme
VDAEDVNALTSVAIAPHERDRHARELVRRARRAVDGIAADPIVEARVCIRPMPVDGRPIVGWLPGVDNAYLIVGHSGVTLAALLAELAVAEVNGAPQADLDAYRLARFG